MTDANRNLVDADLEQSLKERGGPVRCCPEWPECSHMLAWYEKHVRPAGVTDVIKTLRGIHSRWTDDGIGWPQSLIAEAVDALRKAEDANGWRSDAYIGEYQEQLVALYVALADLDRLRGDLTVLPSEKSNRSNSGQTEPELTTPPKMPRGGYKRDDTVVCGGMRDGTPTTGRSGSACPCDGGEGCVCQ